MYIYMHIYIYIYKLVQQMGCTTSKEVTDPVVQSSQFSGNNSMQHQSVSIINNNQLVSMY